MNEILNSNDVNFNIRINLNRMALWAHGIAAKFISPAQVEITPWERSPVVRWFKVRRKKEDKNINNYAFYELEFLFVSI